MSNDSTEISSSEETDDEYKEPQFPPVAIERDAPIVPVNPARDLLRRSEPGMDALPLQAFDDADMQSLTSDQHPDY